MKKKTKQLVDVLRKDCDVLHTFAVTVEAEEAEAEILAQAKARDAAIYAGIVPECPDQEVTTRVHVSRGGPLQPYGDGRHVEAETKEMLEEGVRAFAYRLWEEAGRPDGRADEFWCRARHEHLARRAYMLWQQEGCPEGRDSEFWLRTERFEEC